MLCDFISVYFLLYVLSMCIWWYCIDIYFDNCDTQPISVKLIYVLFVTESYFHLPMPNIKTCGIIIATEKPEKQWTIYTSSQVLSRDMNCLFIDRQTWTDSFLKPHKCIVISLIYLLICEQIFSKLHIHRFIGQKRHLWENFVLIF